MVTLKRAGSREIPATKPVNPERAPLDNPSGSNGCFTAALVILIIRPNRRSIMPSRVRRIMSIGLYILPLTASNHSFCPQLRKSPGGGPPALFTRISGAEQAARTASRPASVVMSPTTVVTSAPVATRISSAVAASVSACLAIITNLAPSAAKAIAHPLPSPLLAAQTNAVFPAIPSSIQ